MFSAADHEHMSRALRLAERGRYTSHPNPRVGCVIVSEGRVIGSGWHAQAGGPHAEIAALDACGDSAGGATAYVTLEPCAHHGRTPPCVDALIDAGVRHVVIAMQDPNPLVAGKGEASLRKAGITVASGLMQEQATRLNAGFVSRMQHRRPRVVLKLAASLDGRTAMASGESKWITSAPAREDVQHLRAESSAIISGVGTVIADDPSLNVRSPDIDTGGRQPMRVIVDSRLRTPPASRLIGLPGVTLIAAAVDEPEQHQHLRRAGAMVELFPNASGKVDLGRLLERLARLECNDVLVETGARLAGMFLAESLVDELVLYLAPHLLGSGARGLVEIPGLETLADKVQLQLIDIRQVGPDLRIRAQVAARSR
ncbi:MAG: bifunctional diaminohydroxyphosphoribosylaminopyrimidine deaminase/5-amino-6-(5-phosphoribosylamino)uracil reductase RibD [Gammaproteobacteria bacterium]